jgi:hypothetical protein
MATYRRICSSAASSLPLQKGSETAKGVLKGLSLKTRVVDPDPGSGAFLTETARSFIGTLSQNKCCGSGTGTVRNSYGSATLKNLLLSPDLSTYIKLFVFSMIKVSQMARLPIRLCSLIPKYYSYLPEIKPQVKRAWTFV